MAPRPFEIFQNSSPSASACTLDDVQSAGLGGGSAAAAAPSPLPLAPWQVTQLVSMVFFLGVGGRLPLALRPRGRHCGAGNERDPGDRNGERSE